MENKSMQCANLDERCWCNKCQKTYYGSISKCPKGHTGKVTVLEFLTDRQEQIFYQGREQGALEELAKLRNEIDNVSNRHIRQKLLSKVVKRIKEIEGEKQVKREYVVR